MLYSIYTGFKKYLNSDIYDFEQFSKTSTEKREAFIINFLDIQ